MSQELIALLKDWLLPPGSILLLLLLGLLFWRRAIGPTLVLVAVITLYLIAIPQTTRWLAAPLETYPSADAQSIRAAGVQAILVFLAGRSHHAPELDGKDGLSPLSLQRLHHAVRLHRQTGLPLVLSGGAESTPDSEGLAVLAERTLRQVYDVQPLIIEDNSRTTRENAIESAQLLQAQGIDKVVLVTSAWHMPRARYSAEQAGLTVLPAGTGFESSSADQAGQWRDWLPTAKALLINRNLLHEYLGILWYRYGPVPDSSR